MSTTVKSSYHKIKKSQFGFEWLSTTTEPPCYLYRTFTEQEDSSRRSLHGDLGTRDPYKEKDPAYIGQKRVIIIFS